MSQADRGERLARYQSARSVPLLIAGFLYLGSFIAFRVDGQSATAILFAASWAVFMVDYVIQLALSPRKWHFVIEHPLYLLSLAFPPLRVGILATVSIRFVRNDNHSLKDRVGLASLVAVAMIIAFGGLLTLIFEAGQPGSNIETYGESLWWASVTLTSVGYGDFVPVTGGGRVMGTLVFSTGVAALAVATATVVGMFTQTNTGERPDGSDGLGASGASGAPEAPEDHATLGAPGKDANLEAVMAKLEEINSRLVAIEQSADRNPGAASTTLSDARRTVDSDEGSADSQSRGEAQ